MDKLRGKTAFITGGASGIGLAIAKAAAAAGMNIVLADLRRAALDEALAWFRDNGTGANSGAGISNGTGTNNGTGISNGTGANSGAGTNNGTGANNGTGVGDGTGANSGTGINNGVEAIGIELNVTDREAFEKAAEEATARFGAIHLLCNNAGVGCTPGPLWEVSYEDADMAIDINLRGVLNGIKAVVPGMIKHGEGGHIVNTSSKNGLLPPPTLGLYNLTKGAVVSLTETLASELPEGYGASVFCPGPFKTNLGDTSREVPALLKGVEAAPPSPPPEWLSEVEWDFDPAEAFAREMPAEEAGRLVIRGVRRGDLYIITHPEFYEGVKARYDAVLRAFPKAAPNEAFKKVFAFLTYNPIFAKQREYI